MTFPHISECKVSILFCAIRPRPHVSDLHTNGMKNRSNGFHSRNTEQRVKPLASCVTDVSTGNNRDFNRRPD